jgi:tRNA-dihydrouridine synthase B
MSQAAPIDSQALRIGPYRFANRLVIAPMAGVTDRPFRMLCKQMGAGYAVSEMVASKPELWQTPKSMRRRDHSGESAPISVQIAGADPQMMAEAAKFNVDQGAQIIDINMGCPAKKVCNLAAGSALLRDEPLLAKILAAVVNAVNVPVTLKTRTGWDAEHKNAVRVAQVAESVGIQALTLHGRTRACAFNGHAEYETIAAVKASVTIPVIANGDIDSPEKARAVLALTKADGIMIGRAAQGRPWLFREIQHFLDHGTALPAPSKDELRLLLREHLEAHYALYGDEVGVRTARKHIGWYLTGLAAANETKDFFNTLNTTQEQLKHLDEVLSL